MPMAAQAATTVSIVSFTANQAGPNLTYTDNGAPGWTLSTVSPKSVLVTLDVCELEGVSVWLGVCVLAGVPV